MSGQLFYDPEFTMPDSKRFNNAKKRKASRSVYSALNREYERIKYLGYRDDLMCRQIVVIRSLN